MDHGTNSILPLWKRGIERGFVDEIRSDHFGKSPLAPLFQRGELKPTEKENK
jgi:hypothetical protein